MSAIFFQMVHPKKAHLCVCVERETDRQRQKRKQTAIVESKWPVCEWLMYYSFKFYMHLKF